MNVRRPLRIRGVAARALWLAVSVALLSPAPPLLAGPPAASIEGRWRLAHQTYGDGGANLAAGGPDLVLEFARVGGRLEGRVRRGVDPQAAVPWPAFVADAGPLPLQILDAGVQEDAGRARARYLVRPAAGDELVLDISEDYSLDPAGAVLSGTMTVRFTRGGEDRGSYTLHRRFERAP